ncbi:MAG: hypothetical protein ACOZIN_00550 [Myxococcota bacterium]
MRRLWWLGVVGLAVLAFVRCGGVGKRCDATTCATGCCDENGVCQAGSSHVACGKSGVACQDCNSTQLVCAPTQVCTTSAGGGGGGGSGGGGGGGTDAGTDGGADGGTFDAGCLVLANFVAVAERGGYLPDDAGFDVVGGLQWNPDPSTNPTAGYRQLWLEVWPLGQTLSFPLSRTFNASTRYDTCDVCVGFDEGCDDGTMTCQAAYFVQGGSVNVTRADVSASGRIEATGTNLRFVEWDYDNDLPVPNGRCVQLGTLTMNIGWDGG